VLTERLRELDAVGVVHRRKLSPPAPHASTSMTFTLRTADSHLTITPLPPPTPRR
jgi:hypothetical protein